MIVGRRQGDRGPRPWFPTASLRTSKRALERVDPVLDDLQAHPARCASHVEARSRRRRLEGQSALVETEAARGSVRSRRAAARSGSPASSRSTRTPRRRRRTGDPPAPVRRPSRARATLRMCASSAGTIPWSASRGGRRRARGRGDRRGCRSRARSAGRAVAGASVTRRPARGRCRAAGAPAPPGCRAGARDAARRGRSPTAHARPEGPPPARRARRSRIASSSVRRTLCTASPAWAPRSSNSPRSAGVSGFVRRLRDREGRDGFALVNDRSSPAAPRCGRSAPGLATRSTRRRPAGHADRDLGGADPGAGGLGHLRQDLLGRQRRRRPARRSPPSPRRASPVHRRRAGSRGAGPGRGPAGTRSRRSPSPGATRRRVLAPATAEADDDAT